MAKQKRKNLMVDEATHKKLKVKSAQTGMTIGDVVRALLPFLSQVKGGNASKKK